MQELMKLNGDADTAKRIVYVWLVLEKNQRVGFLLSKKWISLCTQYIDLIDGG